MTGAFIILAAHAVAEDNEGVPLQAYNPTMDIAACTQKQIDNGKCYTQTPYTPPIVTDHSNDFGYLGIFLTIVVVIGLLAVIIKPKQ